MRQAQIDPGRIVELPGHRRRADGEGHKRFQGRRLDRRRGDRIPASRQSQGGRKEDAAVQRRAVVEGSNAHYNLM
jgi:hypothetical protein